MRSDCFVDELRYASLAISEETGITEKGTSDFAPRGRQWKSIVTTKLAIPRPELSKAFNFICSGIVRFTCPSGEANAVNEIKVSVLRVSVCSFKSTVQGV